MERRRAPADRAGPEPRAQPHRCRDASGGPSGCARPTARNLAAVSRPIHDREVARGVWAPTRRDPPGGREWR
ncbi:hypothetical protein ACFPM0_15790 [Pseudonocardia sulfidoxydans]|uniref:hypothetical protein n=1 Tax=Pseudonocardia sulfidoxydans TaxID=54011 RepID=UPI0036193AD9